MPTKHRFRPECSCAGLASTYSPTADFELDKKRHILPVQVDADLANMIFVEPILCDCHAHAQ